MTALRILLPPFSWFHRLFFSLPLWYVCRWVWLVVDTAGGNRVRVTTTANQDVPWGETPGLVPILGLDVWEHAYYLKYKNKRPDYVEVRGMALLVSPGPCAGWGGRAGAVHCDGTSVLTPFWMARYGAPRCWWCRLPLFLLFPACALHCCLFSRAPSRIPPRRRPPPHGPQAWWSVVDWAAVERRYEEAIATSA